MSPKGSLILADYIGIPPGLQPPLGINAGMRLWLGWFQALDLDETTTFLRDEYLEELRHLNEKIRQVERRLLKQAGGDAVVAKLLSVEGFGPITAITMRAHSPPKNYEMTLDPQRDFIEAPPPWSGRPPP